MKIGDKVRTLKGDSFAGPFGIGEIVGCLTCGEEGKPNGQYAKTLKEAKKLWNEYVIEYKKDFDAKIERTHENGKE